MEINLPAYQLDMPEIEVTTHQGSTRSLGIKNRNIYKIIHKSLAAPIQIDEEYIYDSRYDTDGNMAHILTNVAPRVLVAKEICPRITVVFVGKCIYHGENRLQASGISPALHQQRR